MISTQLKLILAAAAICAATHTRHCDASIIAYTSFGPTDDYARSGGPSGTFGNQELKLAQQFTPTASGPLSQIDLGMTLSDLNAMSGNTITLAIVPDSNGKPGASELWSQTYTNSVYPGPPLGPVAKFKASGGFNLQAGTKYWLTTATPPTSAAHIWWSALIHPSPFAHYYIRGGGFEQEGVWQVFDQIHGYSLRVTVIPEPTAAALMLAASATLLAVRRRG